MLSQHLVQPFLPSVNVLLSLRRNLSLGPVVFDTHTRPCIGRNLLSLHLGVPWLARFVGRHPLRLWANVRVA
jgi:hypothetical protein